MPIIIEHGNDLVDGLARMAPGVERAFDKYRDYSIQNQQVEQRNQLFQEQIRGLVQALADRKAEARRRETGFEWAGEEHDYQRQQRNERESEKRAELEGDRALFRYMTGNSLDGEDDELPQDLKDYMEAVDQALPNMSPEGARALLHDTREFMTDRLKKSNEALAESQIKRMSEPNPTGGEPALDQRTAGNLITLLKMGTPVDQVFRMMFKHTDAVAKARATDGDLVASTSRMDGLLQAADAGQLAGVDPANVQEARHIAETIKGSRLSGSALIARERDFQRTLFGPPPGGSKSRGGGAGAFSSLDPQDQAFKVWEKLPDMERTPKKLRELMSEFGQPQGGTGAPDGAAGGAAGKPFQSLDQAAQSRVLEQLKQAESGEEFDQIMQQNGIDPNTLPDSVFNQVLESRPPTVKKKEQEEDYWRSFGKTHREQLDSIRDLLKDKSLGAEERQVFEERARKLEGLIQEKERQDKPDAETLRARGEAFRKRNPIEKALPALNRSQRGNDVSPRSLQEYLRQQRNK